MLIDEPVADAMLRVDAEADAAFGCGERLPHAAIRFERAQFRRVRKVTEPIATSLATCVLEEESLPAMLALEQFHQCTCLAAMLSRRPYIGTRRCGARLCAAMTAKKTRPNVVN
jgi:hypothetical protein